MTTGPTPPPGRYPTERPVSTRRRWLIILSIVVVAGGLTVAFVGYKKFADPPVSGEATGYDIVDATTIDVQFTVTRSDPREPVACVVRARARDGSEVGRREVLVAPGDAQQTGVVSRVRTSAAPAIGEVFGCSQTVPAYLRPPTD